MTFGQYKHKELHRYMEKLLEISKHKDMKTVLNQAKEDFDLFEKDMAACDVRVDVFCDIEALGREYGLLWDAKERALIVFEGEGSARAKDASPLAQIIAHSALTQLANNMITLYVNGTDHTGDPIPERILPRRVEQQQPVIFAPRGYRGQ